MHYKSIDSIDSIQLLAKLFQLDSSQIGSTEHKELNRV